MWIWGSVFIMHVFCSPLSICSSALEPRSHVKVKCLSLCYVSVPYLPHPSEDFYEAWLKCLVHWVDVQKAKVSHFGSRSRSFWLKVKVTLEGQMFESGFCVHSISTLFKVFPWNFTQMFSSLRLFAKDISQPF